MTTIEGQFHFGLYQDDGDLEVHIQDDSGEEVIVREGVPPAAGPMASRLVHRRWFTPSVIPKWAAGR